ncbi:histidine kinase [Azospirillum sp. ST 5-10]|uniref:sensor histidine kinase n=1 Tax=unclassified Azospirillum TaxID=2630922 RepID=UPI003F4A5F1D
MTKVTAALARLGSAVDPRRRLAAAVGWSTALVSLAVALAVGSWTMRDARQALEREIGLLYAAHAQRLIDTIDTNLAGRREWVAASAALIGGRDGGQDGGQDGGLAGPDAERALQDLKAALGDIEWAGIIDLYGRVTAGTDGILVGHAVGLRPWFTGAFLGPYVGDVHRELLLDRLLPPLSNGEPRRFVDLSAPILDRAGTIRGVLAVTLGWSWIEALQRGALATMKGRPGAEVLLLGIDGTVLFGSPRTPRGARIDLAHYPFGTAHSVGDGMLSGIARSGGFGAFPGLGWSVMVREPVATAFRTADRASASIFVAIALGGLVAALAGAWITSRIMRRLAAMAEAADDLRSGRSTVFEAPSGADEAGRIGRSIASLVGTLQRANATLSAVNEALDARVAERTREIERLGREAQLAAIVRERLRISRDLHDTVAHTLLALLTQIRLIRRLAGVDPARLPEEIDRAEEAARDGLAHARNAVAQLRYTPVRDDGFGPALRRLADDAQDRSPARITLAVDEPAQGLSGQPAETVYRMVEEALRNAVRHADATRIAVEAGVERSGCGALVLHAAVRDDGAGFDPDAGRPDHFGLVGLREQAELIGARLTIASAPGQGTRVTVRVAVAQAPSPGSG